MKRDHAMNSRLSLEQITSSRRDIIQEPFGYCRYSDVGLGLTSHFPEAVRSPHIDLELDQDLFHQCHDQTR